MNSGMGTAMKTAGAAVLAEPARIRVQSVPYGHVYVWHLAEPDGDDAVVRLPDPVVDPDNPMSPWWPPPALDARWVREHAAEFDLVHVNFGFDALTPEHLRDFVDELRIQKKPLVYTVHDLRNPHHEDRELHDRQLDVLVRSADAVLTLTPGAAAEIRRRWDRHATVVPHPHVVPLPLITRARPAREQFVVGVHLKSVRANMAPLPVVDALVEAVAELPGVVLRVDIHDEVMSPTSPLHTPEMARLRQFLLAHAEGGRIDLRVHPFYTDGELWDYLQEIDVSVLPYRFGTHSGWMEACFDLGTPVLAPSCGYYADQRPCLTYAFDENGLDRADLRSGIRRAVEERPTWRADLEERLQERHGLATYHRELYASLLEGPGRESGK